MNPLTASSGGAHQAVGTPTVQTAFVLQHNMKGTIIMSEHEQPCRLCGRGANPLRRLCPPCVRTIALHRATVVTDRPLDEETMLARLIVQRERCWAAANPSPSSYRLDLAVVVVELASGNPASAFMLWPAHDFRRYGRALIDLAENADDFDAVHFHVHDGALLFADQRGSTARDRHRREAAFPAMVATWGGRTGPSACAVRITHDPGAHPARSIGQAAWSRIECAVRACGFDLDPTDRAVCFEHGPAPDIAHGDTVHPADLAIAVALLVDANVIDPAIGEDAVFSAQLGADGTLFPHPAGKSGLVHWAVEGAWTRLHLADLDSAALSATGLEVWGYEHLGDLIDTWRSGCVHTTGPEPHSDHATP